MDSWTQGGMVTASLGVAGARQSHISEAYKPSDSDNPQPSRDLPIPLSRFCPDYVWQPVCNHSTMTSLYQEEYRCESCHRWPPFGFLYRCTIDRDPLLLFAKNKGFEVAFDDIGHKFVEEMTLGKFGADARSEKYSLLKEMSEEQLCSYTPQQLSVLLSQRENVHKAIADERCRTDHPNFPYARRKYPSDKIPWVPDPKFECRRKLCARCHKFGRDKSYLSLNSILSGDILPTVAVSFSFGHMGSRPYCDADMVKNLGYRPVPLPQNYLTRVEETSARELPDPGAGTVPSTPRDAHRKLTIPRRLVGPINGTGEPRTTSSRLAIRLNKDVLGDKTPKIGILNANPSIPDGENILAVEVSHDTMGCNTPSPDEDEEKHPLLADDGAAKDDIRDKEHYPGAVAVIDICLGKGPVGSSISIIDAHLITV